MALSNLHSKDAHTIDSWIANNESPRTDTERMTVAMLSEQLHGLRRPSYISRRWHHLTGTNLYDRPPGLHSVTFSLPWWDDGYKRNGRLPRP